MLSAATDSSVQVVAAQADAVVMLLQDHHPHSKRHQRSSPAGASVVVFLQSDACLFAVLIFWLFMPASEQIITANNCRLQVEVKRCAYHDRHWLIILKSMEGNNLKLAYHSQASCNCGEVMHTQKQWFT